MAKNFVEEGKTVAIVASAAISSGDLVQVGDVFAVALTDIPQGETGYRPRRGDRVVYDGQQWTVTRHERFNGKPMIFIE